MWVVHKAQRVAAHGGCKLGVLTSKRMRIHLNILIARKACVMWAVQNSAHFILLSVRGDIFFICNTGLEAKVI